MDWTEIIGFLISILAIAFLFLRSAWLEWMKRNRPEEYAKAQKQKQKQYEDLLRETDYLVTEEKPKKKPKKEPKLNLPKHIEKKVVTPFSETSSKPVKKVDAYSIRVVERTSRGKQLVQRLRSKKDMVILNEIFSPPKSVRGN